MIGEGRCVMVKREMGERPTVVVEGLFVMINERECCKKLWERDAVL